MNPRSRLTSIGDKRRLPQLSAQPNHPGRLQPSHHDRSGADYELLPRLRSLQARTHHGGHSKNEEGQRAHRHRPQNPPTHAQEVGYIEQEEAAEGQRNGATQSKQAVALDKKLRNEQPCRHQHQRQTQVVHREDLEAVQAKEYAQTPQHTTHSHAGCL
ncbi:MAG: hypothetical protein BWY79_01971 [Actinobacteria bacterium ADurb.Bin444]|nr:MAG: hypothetical protein BWY79_01971 [Actinobacteria bacterium ADurb.Bin444]